MGGFNGGGGAPSSGGTKADARRENRRNEKTLDIGGDGEGQKSKEQPKVSSQMDNTDVKSKMIVADKTAPTEVEMSDDEYALATNKKGRKKTILTSMTGDNSPVKLSKKTLLGG